ncbi:MAG: DUF885 domain-containing protein [Flavobacteriales bacterium]|nr:DUF885 domain-containing protein [Flavobacteriales bacterium]MBP6697103.1 DUF885 domain-containing protein [Flavobacteriales bacterium]
MNLCFGRKRTVVVFGAIAVVHLSARVPPTFDSFAKEFTARYAAMDLEHFTLDMRERLASVPEADVLALQERFFLEQRSSLGAFDRTSLDVPQRLLFDLIAYEVDFQQQRIALEQRWLKAGRPMPVHGLHDMPEGQAWYQLFVQRFTGTGITPDQVFALGEMETQRCLYEIDRLRKEIGFADSASFQRALRDDRFFISDKQRVIDGFARVDSTVRSRLPAFVGSAEVPEVHAMEWPGAGPNTPPGIYLSREDNALNADVFQFNFYGGRYNSRAMGWIYLHEAIPGHHLQSSLRRQHPPDDLRAQLLYPGNFEGWACYVEYYGEELGVYDDPYQRLGKWEWDLVRSVRLVLDAGIHSRGWTHEQALAYWKSHIPGQDAIAEREVTRVTNWAAQALSYKVGADRIQRMREAAQQKLGKGFSAAGFHRAFLDLGMVPITVAERTLAEREIPAR